MKLNRKKLRSMILKEIKFITESQIYPGSGLPNRFTNFDLAAKIYNAVDSHPQEREENLMALRRTAIRREAKLHFALSQTEDKLKQENIRYEIYTLNQALDHLDHHLEIYEHGRHYDEDSHMGQYGLSPKGYALKRRYNRRSADQGHEERGSSKSYDPSDPRYL